MVQELKRLQGKDMSVSSQHVVFIKLLLKDELCCFDCLLVCVLVLSGVAGAGYLPLLPHGLLSGGGVVLLQLPEDVPLDHQRFQTDPFLLL